MPESIFLVLHVVQELRILSNVWSNISNTSKRVSSDIQTLRGNLKKRSEAEFFNNNKKKKLVLKRLRGVWISDETHFQVFDMASQMISNSWRNSKPKLAKRYGN